MGVTGSVNVLVFINEEGKVLGAKAIRGHPLLASATSEAALASKFAPIILTGQKVKMSRIIVCNFK